MTAPEGDKCLKLQGLRVRSIPIRPLYYPYPLSTTRYKNVVFRDTPCIKKVKIQGKQYKIDTYINMQRNVCDDAIERQPKR